VGRIASEALIERLADWGVDTVFGLPGDGINGILEGLRRHQDRVQRIADLLNDGKKVAILAGAGALQAREELLALAERLAAPIVKTLSGKAAVPDDSPFTTGGIGLLGTRPSEELMEEIDTLFMVGTNFPYTQAPATGREGAGSPD
jgi:pyruvate dehydrogenase (quinone)